MKDKLVPFLVVLVIVAAFMVGMMYGKVSVYEGGGKAAKTNEPAPTQGAQAAPPEETPLTDDQWQELLADAQAVKGEKDAKVIVVEYTDYQCPFCARYYEDAYKSIVSDYIDSGKIGYILRDLPLSFHPNAKPAALAARCAGDQGKYWEMHDQLFGNQSEWSEESDPEVKFEGYAKTIGLNVGKYSSCVEENKFGEAIDADLALASKMGATGTPSFFINGKKLVGAQPYAAFQGAIDAALGE